MPVHTVYKIKPEYAIILLHERERKQKSTDVFPFVDLGHLTFVLLDQAGIFVGLCALKMR